MSRINQLPFEPSGLELARPRRMSKAATHSTMDPHVEPEHDGPKPIQPATIMIDPCRPYVRDYAAEAHAYTWTKVRYGAAASVFVTVLTVAAGAPWFIAVGAMAATACFFACFTDVG